MTAQATLNHADSLRMSSFFVASFSLGRRTKKKKKKKKGAG